MTTISEELAKINNTVKLMTDAAKAGIQQAETLRCDYNSARELLLDLIRSSDECDVLSSDSVPMTIVDARLIERARAFLGVANPWRRTET